MNIDAAFRRMDRVMGALGAAGTVAAFVWLGWRGAVAFGFGAAASILNFKWLKGGVDALAAKFSSQPAAEPPKRVAVKFVLRYALLGLTGYGIFTVLRGSMPAFLGGLFVSVAAILAEMIWELAHA